MRTRDLRRTLVVAAIVIHTSGCAAGKWIDDPANEQTYTLRHAPFYKTYRKQTAPPATLACYAVGIDLLTQEQFPDAAAALEPLVAALNKHLDDRGECTRLPQDPLLDIGMPEVFAGSDQALIPRFPTGASDAGYPARHDDDDSGSPPLAKMVLSIHTGHEPWRIALHDAAERLAVDHVLWIHLGISEYPQTTKGLAKRVVLGTDHVQAIPFMRHMRDSMAVVHVTGMLLDRDGNVARVGAEAIAAKPPESCGLCLALALTHSNTENLANVVHMNDTELRQVETARRPDLPGAPFAWEAAIDQLVEHLKMP